VRGASLLVLTLAAVAAGAGCDSGSDGEGSRREGPRAEAQGGGSSPSLVGRLRRGGYILAFRHAATDFSMTDTTRDLRDCSRQRNLNEPRRGF
jgi:hypothetical protein